MAPTPGQILHEKFMGPLGLSASQLARALGVNRSTIGRLIAGESRVTPRMAARLGAYFKTPPRWWLMMQLEFDVDEVMGHSQWSSNITPFEQGFSLKVAPKGITKRDTP